MRKKDGFASEKMLILPAYLLEQLSSHPLTGALYITDIGYFPHARDHYRERPEGCDSFILIHCEEGRGCVSINGVLHPIAERQLIVIPSGTAHTYWADDEHPWTIRWLHFQGSQAAQYAQLLKTGLAPITLGTTDSETFAGLFGQCFDLLSGSAYSTSHRILAMQTLAYAFSLLGLVPERAEHNSQTRHIEAAIRLMNTRIEKSLTLDEIARHVRLSRQHLNHLFKNAVGFAPIDYYLRLKMRRACQLLDLTPLTVQEIAHSLGFKDPYYFSRLFHRTIGMSPTAYRSKVKG